MANFSGSTSTFLEVPLYYLQDIVLYQEEMDPGHKGFIACGDGMNQLTPQEQKIAALIAQGLTNKEIAQKLGVSVFTVRNQVQVIIRNLELKNRVQVAYLFGQQVNMNEIAV